MPRLCLVCAHPKRFEIDQLLAGTALNRVVARQYALGHDAVRRHRLNHLPASLVKAEAAQEIADANTVLGKVQELLTRAWRLADTAEHANDLRSAIQSVRAITPILELLAKLSGELKTAVNITNNIAIAIKGLDEAQIKSVLLAAGHGSWMPFELLSPEENEKRIAELMAEAGYGYR
jgi:hypothetical protein